MAKKFVFIIVSVLLLIFSLAAYKWYKAPRVQWTGSSVSIITASPAPEEIAGWLTYRNQKYGYEIQYSKDFELKEKSQILQYIQNRNVRSNQIEISVLQEATDRDEFGNTTKFQDSKWDSFELFTKYVDGFVEKLARAGSRNESHSYSKQIIDFNGYKSVAIKNQGFPGGGRIIVYYNQMAFQIEYYSISHEYEKIISQIVSTFRFAQ